MTDQKRTRKHSRKRNPKVRWHNGAKVGPPIQPRLAPPVQNLDVTPAESLLPA